MEDKNIKISPEAYKKLKLLSTYQNMTMKQLIDELVESLDDIEIVMRKKT